MSGSWRHLVWVPQVLLALAIGGGGMAKLFADPAMVDLFAEIGAGQWLRYVTGALEVAGAVGLLIPRLAHTAAVGLVALLTGAALTNVVVLEVSPLAPLTYLVVAALLAYARRRSLTAGHTAAAALDDRRP